MVLLNTSSLEPIEEEDVYEHVFNLYTERAPPEQLHLGYIDRRANEIEITLPNAQINFNIQQSLSELSSKGSTTGFLVWKTTQGLLDWILTFSEGPLYNAFSHRNELIVYELGSGIAGMLAATLGPRCRRYVATDQKHLLKLLKANFASNVQSTKFISTTLSTSESEKAKSAKQSRKIRPQVVKRRSSHTDVGHLTPEAGVKDHMCKIDFLEYDWEHLERGLQEVQNLYPTKEEMEYPDIIFGIDTIYNEYLIPHFIAGAKQLMMPNKTVLVVAMQLRDESILEMFLEKALEQNLAVFLVPDAMLSGDLKKGYAVYFMKLID